MNNREFADLRFILFVPLCDHFARLITGLMKVLTFGCSSLFTGEIILYCSKISSNLFTLSCK